MIAFLLTTFLPKLNNIHNGQLIPNVWLNLRVFFIIQKHLENRKCYMGFQIFFDYLNLTLFTQRLLYILGCSGPRCANALRRPPRAADSRGTLHNDQKCWVLSKNTNFWAVWIRTLKTWFLGSNPGKFLGIKPKISNPKTPFSGLLLTGPLAEWDTVCWKQNEK